MKEGTRIKNLATHNLTRSYCVGGSGVVTCYKLTDPVNRRGLIVIRTKGGTYIHLKDVVLP